MSSDKTLTQDHIDLAFSVARKSVLRFPWCTVEDLEDAARDGLAKAWETRETFDGEWEMHVRRCIAKALFAGAKKLAWRARGMTHIHDGEELEAQFAIDRDTPEAIVLGREAVAEALASGRVPEPETRPYERFPTTRCLLCGHARHMHGRSGRCMSGACACLSRAVEASYLTPLPSYQTR